MSTANKVEPRLRSWAGGGWSGADGQPRLELPMTGLLANRYQVQQRLGPNRLLADDLCLGLRVLLRKPRLPSRLMAPGWRCRAATFAARRHPNYLNVLELLRDGGEEFLVTECPSGPSLAQLLNAGIHFTLEEVVRILPLAALDVTAALTTSQDGPTAAGMFIELREGEHRFAQLASQPVSKWPPLLTKIDLWDLIRPGTDARDGPKCLPCHRTLSVAPAVRYTALLTYELLGGSRCLQGCKPIRAFNREANDLLREVIRGQRRFSSSEDFLWELGKANRPVKVAGLVQMARTTTLITPDRRVLGARQPEGSASKPTWPAARRTALVVGLTAAAILLGTVGYEQMEQSQRTWFDKLPYEAIKLRAEPVVKAQLAQRHAELATSQRDAVQAQLEAEGNAKRKQQNLGLATYPRVSTQQNGLFDREPARRGGAPTTVSIRSEQIQLPNPGPSPERLTSPALQGLKSAPTAVSVGSEQIQPPNPGPSPERLTSPALKNN